VAISQDASTPGANTGTVASGSLTVTTPASGSFSPPVNSLVVAIVSMGRGSTTPSLTISDTGSHTWTSGPAVNGSNSSVWIFYTYLSAGATAIRVSAANSVSEGQGIQLDVRVLTGIAPTQTGAASATNTGTGVAWTSSLTTTEVNSWVMIAAAGNAAEATVTANGNTSTLNNYQTAGESSQLSGEQATPTVTPGATTFGWTVGSSTSWSWAALEILPAAVGLTDIPEIQPGPAWTALFKPQWPRPKPPVPPAYTSAVKVSGSITLAPLILAAQSAETSPDQREFQPGTTWYAMFKPWLPRPKPFVAVPNPKYGFGSFRFGPLALSGTVSQTSTDVPRIEPGPTWTALYKPQLPKPRPPVPLPIPAPPVYLVGNFFLAPLALSGAVTDQGFLYLFTGHYAVYYLDYIDINTDQVLSCIPGNSYNMEVASGRETGLSIPPADGRWFGYPGLGDEVVFIRVVPHAQMLAEARALNSDMQARLARGIKPPEEG
jgi:hypothetical protein